jgi:hypothetical protein
MLSKSSINPKKIFIWDRDNPIESIKKKKTNHEFYFSTNLILNKVKKKTIRKIKEPKTKKKKHIRFDR